MARILLVEDTEDNRDVLSRRLRREGHEVIFATNGEEACTQAAACVPDIILMDMQMPVMDGYEATRRIKSNPALKPIPLIGVSAHAISEECQRALEAGCDDYVTKPIDFALLLSKLTPLTSKTSATS